MASWRMSSLIALIAGTATAKQCFGRRWHRAGRLVVIRSCCLRDERIKLLSSFTSQRALMGRKSLRSSRGRDGNRQALANSRRRAGRHLEDLGTRQAIERLNPTHHKEL